MKLENLNLVELEAQEKLEIDGGKMKYKFFKFTLTGVLDGICCNTQSDFELFGFKLW